MSEGNALIRIQKVKYKPNDKNIFIAYTYKDKLHTDVRTSLSNEVAAPEFYDALRNLREHAGKILGFGLEQTLLLMPHTVSYTYDKDTDAMGAVISCLYKTPSGKDININLPLIKCPALEKEEGKPEFFTEKAADAVWEVEIQARHYLTGKRAQISLFGEAGEKEATETQENKADDESNDKEAAA